MVLNKVLLWSSIIRLHEPVLKPFNAGPSLQASQRFTCISQSAWLPSEHPRPIWNHLTLT